MGVSLVSGRRIKDDCNAFDLRIWINSRALGEDREEWSGFGVGLEAKIIYLVLYVLSLTCL